jgi:hypothetical protein
MTPAERQLVADLFDRLAALEDAPRDPDAERAIRDGLHQAPNAVYTLVQTALVQDEALKRANARIQELESKLGIGTPEPPRKGGFLDNMRDNIFGRREETRGSVPNVRPGDAPMGAPPGFRTGAPPMGAPAGYAPAGPMPEPSRGDSFLGTAAAAAAGVIGGSLLLNGIRGMMGGHQPGGMMGGHQPGGMMGGHQPGGMMGGHQPAGSGGFGLSDPAAASESKSPWGDSSGGTGGNGGASGSDDLGRALGRDDIGRSAGRSDDGEQRQGLSGDASDSNDANNFFGNDDDVGDIDDFDSGGGFDGGDDC